MTSTTFSSSQAARRSARAGQRGRLAKKSAEALWYKDAVIYELHVRSFHDADGDGIGDFRGLTQKLDYIQDLGVTAIWLLPFCASPLKDDGYDIADYQEIHPNYGILRDFKALLKEAHRRGLKVITELVINHTSDQHPWFQRARQAKPGSSARDFYVWSDSAERYKETRIIFKDFEGSNWSWDPVAKAYYWHRFYSHQPDLNFDNPRVRKAILQVLDFWLELGVDGLRLDAVPYLYEREGTSCENLPETHAFLKQLRRHVDERFKNRMLLAEANQWPEDASAYFGKGDECHTAFHFPLMPRLFMSLRMEDRYPIIEILQQTPKIPEACQWAIFLRNHDELTLEMVTDQERDYMYRVYAGDPQMRINVGIRRRLAPLLWNNRKKIELMNALLLSLPGTPVIYYGDELGMGDNIYLGDRNGVRTPMQWSSDRNAGFSRSNPQKLYLPVIIDPEYHYEAMNVEAQQNNPSSLLWWMKRILALRKRYHAFGRGSMEFLYPENRKILAAIRRYQDETLLLVANLSRFTQCAELDLSAFREWVPLELFGQAPFPPIGDLPYFLTMGPHNFYWFSLEKPVQESGRPAGLSSLEVSGSWKNVFDEKGPSGGDLERALPAYLRASRWFGGKTHTIRSVKVTERVDLSEHACLIFVQVDYTDMEAETYLLPLTWVPNPLGETEPQNPDGVVAALNVRAPSKRLCGWLRDASKEEAFAKQMLDAVRSRRRFRGRFGEMTASSTRTLRDMSGGVDGAALQPSTLRGEQSNTSIRYGDQLVLKLFRRLEAGVNPDLEIGRFLTEQGRFKNTPATAGAIEYRRARGEAVTIGILQQFVPNEGDAWKFTLDEVSGYYERALAQPIVPTAAEALNQSPLELARNEIPADAQERVGPYIQSAEILGRRTAELHLALSSGKGQGGFVSEPFSQLYQRSVYQAMRSLTARTLQMLRKRLPKLPGTVSAEAESILSRESEILDAFEQMRSRRIGGMRIRCHGDYHLGQVLYTGKDFVIIDFEGEPAHTITERRLKHSPLRDVAGMMRSFHYASYSSPLTTTGGVIGGRALEEGGLEAWAQYWYAWVSAAFLRAYLGAAEIGGLLPEGREELRVLLGAYLMEKAVYELQYEMNNRPGWLGVPLRGIEHLLTAGVG